MRPLLLDLFCGAGGAAMGYDRAGFEVVGVDLHDQPRYPFTFIRDDALFLLERLIHHKSIGGGYVLGSLAAIHASPPCQHYSDLAHRNGNADEHPDLIDTVRDLLEATGLPWVIENVEGAPLRDPITLCGTMFPELAVLRHRLFETNWPWAIIPAHRSPHPLVYTRDKRKAHYGKLDEATSYVSVNGGGNCSVKRAREAMGIDWMTKAELNEAIPPAYTEWIGKQLIEEVQCVRIAA